MTALMAKKHDDAGDAQPRPKGRPKGSGRLKSRYSIVHTPEYRTWMDSFLEFAGESEVSDAFREAMRRFAEAKGFRPPPKR